MAASSAPGANPMRAVEAENGARAARLPHGAQVPWPNLVQGYHGVRRAVPQSRWPSPACWAPRRPCKRRRPRRRAVSPARSRDGPRGGARPTDPPGGGRTTAAAAAGPTNGASRRRRRRLHAATAVSRAIRTETAGRTGSRLRAAPAVRECPRRLATRRSTCGRRATRTATRRGDASSRRGPTRTTAGGRRRGRTRCRHRRRTTTHPTATWGRMGGGRRRPGRRHRPSATPEGRTHRPRHATATTAARRRHRHRPGRTAGHRRHPRAILYSSMACRPRPHRRGRRRAATRGACKLNLYSLDETHNSGLRRVVGLQLGRSRMHGAIRTCQVPQRKFAPSLTRELGSSGRSIDCTGNATITDYNRKEQGCTLFSRWQACTLFATHLAPSALAWRTDHSATRSGRSPTSESRSTTGDSGGEMEGDRGGDDGDTPALLAARPVGEPGAEAPKSAR